MARKLNYERIKENVKESQREPLEGLMEGILTTEQILEASSNGLIVTDKDGSVHFVNTQAENILGLDKKNIRDLAKKFATKKCRPLIALNPAT